MDFNLEEGLEENEEGEGVNQPHNGEKLNKCNQCDYSCSQAGNLRRHLKMHSGEKSNKCNQCDFVCSAPSSLGRHMKKHSVERRKGKK